MVNVVNWTEILDSAWGTQDVRDFVRGNISRDNMIELYPELRSVIRSKGVQSVRQAARKALNRRNVTV
jgi:hypothetical protein